MPDLSPEKRARQQIDAQLTACGWVVQDYKAVEFAGGRGIAVGEVPLTSGPCDYLLLVDRKACGVIEAKKEETTLSTVAERSARYANSLPAFLKDGNEGALPFRYESTGVETFFRAERDPAPRSRRIFTFHRPETFADDIVYLCREVFGKGNDFCKKITYHAKHSVTGKPAKSKELACNCAIPFDGFNFNVTAGYHLLGEKG